MRNTKLTKYYILTLAITEGFCVMASELLSAKFIAPYFGSSLYVWSAVLGITLSALMGGYYFGGYLSEKTKNGRSAVLVALSLGAALLILMPFLASSIMKICIEMSVLSGVIASLLIFLFPPLFLFGTSSPLLIDILNKELNKAGKASGTIYSISTLGGIAATFLLGFYLIPEYGLTIPAVAVGSLLLIITTFGFFNLKKKVLAGVNIIVMLFGLVNSAEANNKNTGEYNLLYASEGILGQIKVIEQPFTTYSRGTHQGRLLFVNNTVQTIAYAENSSKTLWDWSFFYKGVSSLAKKDGNVLLLGLGGGTFYHQLTDLGYVVDAVELDQRIKDVAVKYFSVPEDANVIIDDARHFVNINKKKYDLVLMDLFLNETPPAHALTLESFEKVKSDLNENGFIMINFYGFLTGDNGQAARSIIKTVKECNLYTYVLPTPGEEHERNLIIIGSKSEMNFNKIDEERVGCTGFDIESKIIDFNNQELENAVVLLDNKPKLEKLYLNLSINWRNSVTKYYTKNLIEYNL